MTGSLDHPEASTSVASESDQGVSIQFKLVGLIVVLVSIVVGSLAVYFPWRNIDYALATLEQKAATYGMLVSRQVESAIAFDDRETAREVFDSVAQDPDVVAMVLYTSQREVLHALGTVSQEAKAVTVLAVSSKPQVHVAALEHSLVVTAPVVSMEGARGSVLLELSTRAVEEARVQELRVALFVGLLTLVSGAAVAWIIGRSVSRRVRVLAERAVAVAEGDLDCPELIVDSTDELGTLARSFNAMVGRLRSLIAEIKTRAEKESHRLEQLVDSRTAELGQRNRDMRLVFDNTEQGLVMIDRAGKMSDERSLVLSAWLGKPPESGNIWDYVAGVDAEVAEWFRESWEQLLLGFMPTEVSLTQLQRPFQVGECQLKLDVKLIPLDGRDPENGFERALVVISDVTAGQASENARIEQRELMDVFSRLVRDREGFFEFVAEAETQIMVLSAAGGLEQSVVMAQLHTLKGNCAIFGIQSVAELCHQLESEVIETGEAISEADGEKLAAAWDVVLGKLTVLVGHDPGTLEVEMKDYSAVLAATQRGAGVEEVRLMLEAWQLEPVKRRLERLGEQAKSLAERLGKGPLDVRVESNGIRLHREHLTSFWSAMTHAVRNAMDHGMETTGEREQSGKGQAWIALRAWLATDRFCVELEDSGRGIDWNKLASRAKRAGLPHRCQDDLVAALFTEGLSTSDQTTTISGRGIGMGALKAACEELDGWVDVSSSTGEGTRLTFVFPISAFGDQPPQQLGLSASETQRASA